MKYGLFSIITAVSFVGIAIAPPVAADDETAEVQALKKEVKALEARLAQMEKREKSQKAQVAQAIQAAPVASATQAPQAADLNNLSSSAGSSTASSASSKSLTQRVAALEQAEQTQAATTPSVSVGPTGLIIASPDKQYSVNVHGYVQLDDRTFLDGGTKTGTTNTFLVRSARPIIDAKMTDYFDTHFMMDFGKGSSTLLDAYGNIHPIPGNDMLNFRVGETKSPVGLERWESEQDVEFVERGQTTNLVPYRDIGVLAYGNPIPKQVEYELGVMNGAADYQVNTGDTDQNKDVVGRIFTHPLVWSGINALQGVGVGVGGTFGNHQGTPGSLASSDLTTNGYLTVGQRAFFMYSGGTGGTNVFADGTQWRLNPQAMYYNGSFGTFAEYVINNQEVGHGTTLANATTVDLRNTAWEGVASYVLTGENAAFDGVKPAHNFDPQSGYWGAFELVGRLSQLEVDKRAFPVFASLATSSNEAFEHTIGGTWYFNPAVKLNLDFSYTTFDKGAVGDTDHEAERAVMSRVQLKF